MATPSFGSSTAGFGLITPVPEVGKNNNGFEVGGTEMPVAPVFTAGVTIIGGKNAYFYSNGFNNIMAGARIICGSDRFDGSGLFGAMIPSNFKGKQIMEPVIMEKFSNIGTNAIVLPGSTLREGVLLAAGSLLMGDTEAWGVYKGNPAVLVKKIDPTITKQKYNEFSSSN